MSKYGDQTNCENLDCVFQLEICQAGYLLNNPRRRVDSLSVSAIC